MSRPFRSRTTRSETRLGTHLAQGVGRAAEEPLPVDGLEPRVHPPGRDGAAADGREPDGEASVVELVGGHAPGSHAGAAVLGGGRRARVGDGGRRCAGDPLIGRRGARGRPCPVGRTIHPRPLVSRPAFRIQCRA